MNNKNNTTPHYAGFWVRLFASFIDITATTPFVLFIVYIFGSSDYFKMSSSSDFYSYSSFFFSSHNNDMVDFFTWGFVIAYSVFLVTSNYQGTIGKRLMGIYIATKNGKKLTAIQAFFRFLFSIFSVSFFGIGVLMIAFTKEKTALHDLICDTRVFHGKK